MISFTDTAEGVIFSVKVVPGSSRTRFSGEMGSLLKITVAAPAEKGKAHACLTEYLAGLLGIRKNAITILSGQTSPVKQIRAAGITADTLRQILSSAARKKK